MTLALPLFTEYAEIAGYAKVRLWMACHEKAIQDVVMQIRKIDKPGTLLEGIDFPVSSARK
ncbi:hypothetical protein LTR17_024894 [Elasticomyces elasticus]|nr:hypothetical protein LTR17_024894 [Elasticomyces elasticus]